MKKPFSLDWDNIERDVDRLAAVKDILDKLEKNPSPSDLELMANYILYGKDENGLNAVQRGEIIAGNTRYNSYRRKDDKLLSLDAMLENPMTNQQELKPSNQRDVYRHIKPSIKRPKYDKKTGELIDIGDGDIPGMQELWDCIDEMEHWIAVLEGKVPPREDDLLFDNSYRLYQLKHSLIDIRRHQYYLRDAYKPTLHFLDIDHPKHQYIDWTCDSYYWMTIDEWHRKVDGALVHTISKNLDDYETRTRDGTIEVKWMVREHTFDWENFLHVRELMGHYSNLYDQMYDKIDTYARTLIFDFERYRAMCHFTELREFLVEEKITGVPYTQILADVQQVFGIKYNENHLCSILANELPKTIALTAKKHRLLLETPKEKCKVCFRCKRLLPRDPVFFARNRSHKDGFCSNCKECEKQKRIEKGEQSTYDRRSKEKTLREM